VVGVQLAGHDTLKGLGIDFIPASAPDFCTEDTPTAVLVRRVLGAIAQFEKPAWSPTKGRPGSQAGSGWQM
jgi:hypothetical protein